MAPAGLISLLRQRRLGAALVAAVALVAVLGGAATGAAQAQKSPAAPGAEADPALRPGPGSGLPTVRVECNTTQGRMDIDVTWALSPRGAERFMELVNTHFFTNMVFFRVVKGFVAQTGIPRDKAVRAYWTGMGMIPDDPPRGVRVLKGTMAFAGSGVNSRTTQVFWALGDQPKLGLDPWETAFGQVTAETLPVLDRLYTGYGDGPPFGSGPRQFSIMREGYAYVERRFPKLDYIHWCRVAGGSSRGSGRMQRSPYLSLALGQPPPQLRNAYRVECTTTHGPLDLDLVRSWSPHGVERVLELVATNHYSGAAIYRSVCGFLTQFGIAAPKHVRRYWAARAPAQDDPPLGKPISRGTLLLIGGKPHSRRTELMIALADQPNMGKAPWETPLGFVSERTLETLNRTCGVYGDIVPWGNGPKQDLIRDEGNEYLRANFPKLPYIHKCRVLPPGAQSNALVVADARRAKRRRVGPPKQRLKRSLLALAEEVKAAPVPGAVGAAADPHDSGGTGDAVLVTCATTQGELALELFPASSPIGVQRLLDLVRAGFFEDVALFRAIAGFLVQFGVAADPAVNARWARQTLPDEPANVPLRRGDLAYAGSGQNSRSTQMFMVLADGHANLGKMPWETRIGRVRAESLPVLDSIFTGYGDSPDQMAMFEQGNAYLRAEFPQLDYIRSCRIGGGDGGDGGGGVPQPEASTEAAAAGPTAAEDGPPARAARVRTAEEHSTEMLVLFVVLSVVVLVVLLPGRAPPGLRFRGCP